MLMAIDGTAGKSAHIVDPARKLRDVVAGNSRHDRCLMKGWRRNLCQRDYNPGGGRTQTVCAIPVARAAQPPAAAAASRRIQSRKAASLGRSKAPAGATR
ncbi:hypothetical protein FRZ44_50690 [Hypericibacter terrae]|uniref:Uncharacterized protein n=1 Tax=Hypericibacter terrae TaxID=2602015 RepID=A0A5J6MQS4_9PROT|nr:hypothetical protein FRZ44_50690 [Hypericibacter terrae]